MLADTSTRSLGRGSLAPGVHKPNIFLMQLVDFIAEHLGRWRDHPERQAVQSEPELNAQLGAYLNGEARYSMDVVQFTMEVPDSVQPGRRLDIAAQPSCAQIRVEGRSYTRFDVLLPIECKRLPTPVGQRRDERENVVVGGSGTTGGIQRFKLGAHGAAQAMAVIIGYIQDGDAEQWLQSVNGWLTEAGMGDALWAGEQLTAVANAKVDDVHRFHSIHRRLRGAGNVGLWHLWIVMAPGAMKRRGKRLVRRRAGDSQGKLPFMY